MKSVLATLACLLALQAIFVGCGGSPSGPAPEAQPPAVGAPTTDRELPAPSPRVLIAAAEKGALPQVEDQIAAGVDVNGTDPDGRTALMFSAFEGHTPVVAALLAAGAGVNDRDPAGRDALMYAATGPFPDTVELLLERGADPAVTDNGERFTALMHAAAEGHAPVVEVLLRYGADPTTVDVDGDTALSFARQNGHAAVVRLLTTQPGD